MTRFGPFTLDPETGELRRQDGTIVPLEPQPARVLAVLAARPGQLVSRDELSAAVWPEGTHVEFDQGLNYCIRQIRTALGDDARRPVFIETVARRGYRFLSPRRSVMSEGRAPAGLRRAAAITALVAGLVGTLWVVERFEDHSGGRAHHDAVVGVLKAVHDLIF